MANEEIGGCSLKFLERPPIETLAEIKLRGRAQNLHSWQS